MVTIIVERLGQSLSGSVEAGGEVGAVRESEGRRGVAWGGGAFAAPKGRGGEVRQI